jgi:predicted RNA binding protein YcfA (HicA-like mRNA interferase family)
LCNDSWRINSNRKKVVIYFENRNCHATFAVSKQTKIDMKSSELHRLILSQGWQIKRQTGSHVIYTKNGKVFPVPNHGSKEVHTGIEKKIKREMGL